MYRSFQPGHHDEFRGPRRGELTAERGGQSGALLAACLVRFRCFWGGMAMEKPCMQEEQLTKGGQLASLTP